MNPEIRTTLENLVCGFLKTAAPPIDDAQVLAQLSGWDSLKFMHILFAAENEWKIRFDAHEVVQVKTWGDFLKLINVKKQALST